MCRSAPPVRGCVLTLEYFANELLARKGFYLMTTLDHASLSLLTEAAAKLDEGFTASLPAYDPAADIERLRPVLLQVAQRMQNNYPYHHPFYAGQMLKPPHPVARLAYALAMFINPNNHALDGGRESSKFEKECVADIARMFGWETHLGHLTGGGTLANLEGLWAAGELMGRDKKVVASEQAHYTHSRISGVLGLPFAAVDTDNRARMSIDALRAELDKGDVGTVVVTLGTTATGAVDPLPDVLALREAYGFRVHIDTAYGGYFKLADNLAAPARAAYDCIAEADSVAIDPHKHGLQPYGCGCIVFKDPSVGTLYNHDSPYTYFSSDELHLGEISLECSRAGASAVALWATHQLLPPVPGGEFAADVAKCRAAALDLYTRLKADDRYAPAFEPELDIINWMIKADSVSEASAKAQAYFDAAAEQAVHLALATLPVKFFEGALDGMTVDAERITCVRACLMKPEHADWLDRLWDVMTTIEL